MKKQNYYVVLGQNGIYVGMVGNRGTSVSTLFKSYESARNAMRKLIREQKSLLESGSIAYPVICRLQLED